MFVCVTLQLLYITKFYCWERGYFRTMNMAHDRAGCYICWAVWCGFRRFIRPPPFTWFIICIVSRRGSPSFYWFSAADALLGYWVNSQRTWFRERRGKLCTWGQPPVYTEATYESADGIQRVNLLLASGFWGLARHFRFVSELLAALSWSLPALFDHFLPYFYLVFVTILLWHRLYRDEERCRRKYGKDWEAHCRKVPCKLIPYVY